MEDEKSWDDGLCDKHAAGIMKAAPSLIMKRFASSKEGRRYSQARYKREIDRLKDEIKREEKAIRAKLGGYESPSTDTTFSYFGEPISTTSASTKPPTYSYFGDPDDTFDFKPITNDDDWDKWVKEREELFDNRTRDEKYYESLKARVEKEREERKKNYSWKRDFYTRHTEDNCTCNTKGLYTEKEEKVDKPKKPSTEAQRARRRRKKKNRRARQKAAKSN